MQTRKKLVIPKVKKMADFAIKRLEISQQDQEQIEAVKDKLQSID